MSFDEQMMQRCLQLAKLGLGLTYPNPMVGCVVVHDGKIIGEGWHQKAGCPHAEVHAISQVKDLEILKKSTLYVSLEPCAHFGKTPPCADLIIEKKIPKVVIGTQDPFSKVNGMGIQKLRDAGIEVIVGVLEKECQEINKRFFHFYQFKRPYIILKWAQTQNGFMGSVQPEQKWISNKFSKQLSHKWRTEEQSILVGTNTARIDNPQLNSRLWSENSPIRIVIDRQLSLPQNLHLFDQTQKTIVVTEVDQPNLENLEFVKVSFSSDFLMDLMEVLYQRNIQSIIVEGGKKVLETFVNSEFWDEARIITSPIIWDEGISGPIIKGELQNDFQMGTDRIQIFKK